MASAFKSDAAPLILENI